MTKRTLFLIFVLVATVSILTFLAVLQSVEKGRQEEIKTKALPTPTINPSLLPDTTLTAQPQGMLIKKGGSQVVDIIINTGQNTLITVQLEIGFDPQFLEIKKAEAGTFFPNATELLNEVDLETGRVALVVGSLTPQKGTGVIARLTLIGKKPTGPTGRATNLSFLPKTQVLGSSNLELNSLLKQASGAQFVVTNE